MPFSGRGAATGRRAVRRRSGDSANHGPRFTRLSRPIAGGGRTVLVVVGSRRIEVSARGVATGRGGARRRSRRLCADAREVRTTRTSGREKLARALECGASRFRRPVDVRVAETLASLSSAREPRRRSTVAGARASRLLHALPLRPFRSHASGRDVAFARRLSGVSRRLVGARGDSPGVPGSGGRRDWHPVVRAPGSAPLAKFIPAIAVTRGDGPGVFRYPASWCRTARRPTSSSTPATTTLTVLSTT